METLNTKQKLFIEALEKNALNVASSCKIVKVSRSLFYQWFAENDLFRIRVEELRESVVDFVESKLMQNINNNDQKAIEYFLNTRARHRGYVQYAKLPADYGLKTEKEIKQVEE